MAKTPTLHTCVVSGKPIRQKHIDDGLVMDWAKGKALISAVQGTVKDPPENPVVFGANEVSLITLNYERYNFPRRIVMRGRTFKSLPISVYIQNQEFRLFKDTTPISLATTEMDETEDKLLVKGTAIYKAVKIKTESVDKPEDN